MCCSSWCDRVWHDLEAEQEQQFISYSSGDWKCEVRVSTRSGSGENSFLCCSLSTSLCILTRQKAERGLEVSFIRTLTPFMRALLSWVKCLPKSPSPDTIILWVKVPVYEFWRPQILIMLRYSDLDIQILRIERTFFGNCYRYLGTFLASREANLICTGA